MIESKLPDSWVDLQNLTARILSECGFETETPKIIHTVRGRVEVDVYSVDRSVNPAPIYICECKHWNKAVSQTVIHGFRTVINDFGANWGLIVSSNGFQAGAFEAIKNTNIKLLNWLEFQILFEERWYKTCFSPRIYKEAVPLIDYTEPINSRIFEKAEMLNPTAKAKFRKLREKYQYIAYLGLVAGSPSISQYIELPLTDRPLSPDILGVVSYREFMELLLVRIREGLSEFDDVFGCRA